MVIIDFVSTQFWDCLEEWCKINERIGTAMSVMTVPEGFFLKSMKSRTKKKYRISFCNY